MAKTSNGKRKTGKDRGRRGSPAQSPTTSGCGGGSNEVEDDNGTEGEDDVIMEPFFKRVQAMRDVGVYKFTIKGIRSTPVTGIAGTITDPKGSNTWSINDENVVRNMFTHLSKQPLTELTLFDCELTSSSLNTICKSSLQIANTNMCQTLRVVNFSHNNIGSAGASVIAEWIRGNSCANVENLSMSNCRLAGIHIVQSQIRGKLDLQGIEEFLMALSVNKTLKVVDISQNYLGGVPPSPFSNRKRDTVTDDQNVSSPLPENYGHTVIEILGRMLFKNDCLVTLNLNSNGFEDDPRIAKHLLMSRGPSSKLLSFCGVHYSFRHLDTNEVSSKRFSMFSPTLSSNPSLYPRTLSLASTPTYSAASSSSSTSSTSSSPILSTFSSSTLTSASTPAHNAPPKPITEPILDLSSRSLHAITGRLLGVEPCLRGSVTKLDLSNNITFGDNGIHNLIDALVRVEPGFISLQVLHLKKINISFAAVISICQLLKNKHAESLTELDISENPLVGDRGIQQLSGTLPRHKSLKSLSMRMCGMTSTSCQALCNALIGNTCLLHLDLSNNTIEDTGAITLSNCLRTNSTLKTLNLAYNKIRNHAPVALGTSLTTGARGLQRLDLSGNPTCGRRAEQTFDPTPIINFAEKLKTCTSSLQELILSHSDIGARSSKKLMESLKFNVFLHTLEIDNCNVSEQGAQHIGEALPDLQALKRLTMSSCNIGPAGCTRLFLGLAYNTSVVHLDVSSNQITGYPVGENNDIEYDFEAVAAISTALATNKTLTSLNLRNNRLYGISNATKPIGVFDVRGLHEITRGIVENARCGGSLKTMNLLDNKIRECCRPGQVDSSTNVLGPGTCPLDETMRCHVCTSCDSSIAVTELIDAMRSHPTLMSLCGLLPGDSYLDLGQRYLDEQTTRIIAAELLHNHYLKGLNIENNDIGDIGAHSIATSVLENVVLTYLRFPVLSGPFDSSVLDINVSKMKSFQFRLAICTFLHNYKHIGAAVLSCICEFLMGEGPAVIKFILMCQC